MFQVKILLSSGYLHYLHTCSASRFQMIQTLVLFFLSVVMMHARCEAAWPPIYAAPKTSSQCFPPFPRRLKKKGNPERPQKFAGWKKKWKIRGGVYEKAQQDRQQLQQLGCLEALLPCRSVLEFFALFLQILLDVLLTPVHFHMR